MFRELIRKKQELPFDECIEILQSEKRGVLSVLGDDNYPYGIPMNHFYNEEDGAIYFHCGKAGHKLDSIKRHDKVSFCVYTQGVCNLGEWALNVKSVIAFGRIEIIDDMEKIINITTALGHKFTTDDEYIKEEIERAGKRVLLLKLQIEHLCGKAVKEA